uniref:Uncharacterized protein n=1 Tax=Eutreptiella gymnastica TaxID=73025 RepID=A0A7S4GAH7_9EUGL
MRCDVGVQDVRARPESECRTSGGSGMWSARGGWWRTDETWPATATRLAVSPARLARARRPGARAFLPKTKIAGVPHVPQGLSCSAEANEATKKAWLFSHTKIQSRGHAAHPPVLLT